MLTEYHNLVVGGVIRTFIGCLVLFGLVPRLVLPVMVADQPWRRRAANVLVSGALVVVIVHLLVLATMYDGVAFIAVCLGLWSVRLWYTSFRDRHHGFGRAFAGLLRTLDLFSWKYAKESGSRWLSAMTERFSGFHAISVVTLAAVIVAAGVIRLLPVWNHAAPFSVEYYETLEQVKRLQLNQMYIQGYRVPMGLPMIAQTLSLLSQVNVAIVLHFLGAVSSMMLTGAIAYVVYRATSSLEGSIIGAALFGVFNHVLPMDLRYQVEADSLVLACAFLLPSLSFLADYCAEPRLRTLAIVLAGLFCTLTINLFAGGMALAGAFIVLVGALILSFRLPWLRGRQLLALAAVIGVLLGGSALFVKAMMEDGSLKNAMEVLLYDQHVNRYFSMNGNLPQLFVWTCVALFTITLFLSPWRFSNKGFHLHLFSWGAFGIALLLLVQYSSDDIVAILPISQIDFVLSVLVAIALGITVGWGRRIGSHALERMQARGWMKGMWQLVAVAGALLVMGLSSPPESAVFDYTVEPDGFAKSLYLIEQRYMPYQWTAVSHRGTALSGMNRGRFLDYGYFFSRYDPETYKHGSKEAVPTPVLFIFVERTRASTNIATELSTGSRVASENIKEWLDTYQKYHADLRIFYGDDDVVVYKIEDPAVNALRE